MLPGLILLLIFLVITIRNFRYGLFIFLAVLPAYVIRLKIFGLPTTMLEALFWILFVIWIIKNVTLNSFQGLVDRSRNKFGMTMVGAVILFFGSSIIAIFISPNHLAALGIWRADYPNAVGLFAAPILPLVLAQAIKYFRERASKMKLAEAIILCVIFALGVGAIVFAKSDGAVVGLAAGLSVFGLLYNRKTRLAVAVALIAVSIVILVVPGVGPKVANQFLFGDWSGYVRQTIWSETWAMLRDNPLFGAGLAGYQTVFAPYHHAKGIEIFMYPHNIIFNFWSELGMLGLLAFGWMMWGFFRIVILNRRSRPELVSGSIQDLKYRKEKIPKPAKATSGGFIQDDRTILLAVISSMIIILVHGLVDVPYFKNDLAFLFWVIFAIPFVIINENHPS